MRGFLSSGSIGCVLLGLVACGGPTGGSGTDSGVTVDSGGAGADGGGGIDAAAIDATAATDATTAADANGPDTAWELYPDGALMCGAGIECLGYQDVLAVAARGATSLGNCVVQLHRLDCCGAQAAYGINHASRTELCPAETACLAQYASPPGCADTTITTDTGETTSAMSEVRLRIVDPMPCGFDPSVTCYRCETFVCTTAACAGAPGIAGGCGP